MRYAALGTTDLEWSDVPMQWETLISQRRAGNVLRLSAVTDVRSAFESDVDRLIFASCFRRLSRKTQVYPFATNDHVHTRLTHSLEVAQVGRALGRLLARRLGGELPSSISENDVGAIVQAACLAHDLGNPPFGHAGEEAISNWFQSQDRRMFEGLSEVAVRDLSRFEGNAQGFRMLTQTESNLFDGGLRLTGAVLGAFVKYPKLSREATPPEKFGIFLSEEKIFRDLANDLGLKKRGDHSWSRHPLAFLTEAADDICYATLDIEDAVEEGIVLPEQAYEILLGALDEDLRSNVRARMTDSRSYRVNFSRMRGPVFDALIAASIDSFADNYDSIMRGEFSGELIEALPEGDRRRRLIAAAKNLAQKDVYSARFMSELELGCFATMDCLLGAFCHAANECHRSLVDPNAAMSWRSKLVLRQLGNHSPCMKSATKDSRKWSQYDCWRRMIDYVSGMTDNYARDLAERIRGSMPR
jgi:dGTPase